ncbi:MAG: class I SAM-dependent methyltransferase [Candidatus Micrarchaeia archaeon]
MIHKISKPEDILLEAQKLYPTKFHEVSESTYMDEVYRKAAALSGIKEYVGKTKREVNVADIAGGSGRQGHIIRSMLKDEARRVTIHNIDISKEELSKRKVDERIVGEIMHLPFVDRSMDFVFMNNIPIPISHVRNYVAFMKDESGRKGMMLEMLELAVDSVYKLNTLEGARVLKDNGVMVVSGKYTGQSSESIQKGLGELPLKVEKFEVVELEEGVIPLWRKYGIEIEKPTFMVASFRKTSSDLKEHFELYEQMLYTSLEQLMRIEGFEDVLKEMHRKNLKW